jgi:hypothetical protein
LPSARFITTVTRCWFSIPLLTRFKPKFINALP